jgi:hypothetical protein
MLWLGWSAVHNGNFHREFADSFHLAAVYFDNYLGVALLQEVETHLAEAEWKDCTSVEL